MEDTDNQPASTARSDKEFWYFTGSGSANTRFSFNYYHPDAQVRDYYRIDRWTGISIGGLSVSNSGNATWNDMGGTPPAPLQLPFLPLAARAVRWPGSTIARRGCLSPARAPDLLHGPPPAAKRAAGLAELSRENTSHFEVERSSDGRNLRFLPRSVPGNSSSVISYSASDMSPFPELPTTG